MRILALLVAVALTACAAQAEDSDAPVVAASTEPQAEDAGTSDRGCDGSNTRHICGAIAATSTFRYGASPTCTATPYLQPTPGDYVPRAEGRTGCVEVSGLTGNGPARALCCP